MGKRLRLEAQIAARLLHDNVVRIYDFGQAEGTWYLVMEQVDGTSYVKRWRALTLAERLRILAQVADALDYAHHQGVIHRDIKPGNVLLTATDVPKLSDFGLSLHGRAGRRGRVDPGHAALHEPRAEQGEAARLPDRPLLAGGDALRVGHRHRAVHGQRDVGDGPARRDAAGAAQEPEPRDLPSRSSADPEPPGQAARGPARAAGPPSAAALREEIERIRRPRSLPRRRNLPRLQSPARPSTWPRWPRLDESARPAPRPTRPSRRGRRRQAGRGRARAPCRSRSPPPASAADLVASPLVRTMLRTVLSEPVMLSADERYLMGHYLAYLLIGSRRKGIFQPPAARSPQRRPRAIPPGHHLRPGLAAPPRRPSRRPPACSTSGSTSAPPSRRSWWPST